MFHRIEYNGHALVLVGYNQNEESFEVYYMDLDSGEWKLEENHGLDLSSAKIQADALAKTRVESLGV